MRPGGGSKKDSVLFERGVLLGFVERALAAQRPQDPALRGQGTLDDFMPEIEARFRARKRAQVGSKHPFSDEDLWYKDETFRGDLLASDSVQGMAGLLAEEIADSTPLTMVGAGSYGELKSLGKILETVDDTFVAETPTAERAVIGGLHRLLAQDLDWSEYGLRGYARFVSA